MISSKQIICTQYNVTYENSTMKNLKVLKYLTEEEMASKL